MINRIILYPWPGMRADKTVALLAECGFNSLGLMVKPIEGPPIVETDFFAGRDDGTLDALIKEARSHQMEVVGKLSVMCDLRLCYARPDLISIARNAIPLVHPFVDRDWYGFLCPNREETISAYVELLERVLAEHEMDAINLEYVAHAFAKQEDDRRIFACYCTRCRDEFRQQTGQDPLELPQLSSAWVQWRSDKIAENLRAFKKVARGHSTVLEVTQDQESVAEHRIDNMYMRALGIDLNLTSEIVDRFCPKLVHGESRLAYRQLRHFRDGFNLDLVPEVTSSFIGKPEDFLAYLKTSELSGCAGIALAGYGALPGSIGEGTLRSIGQLVCL
jgi:hypothetical protein